MTATELGYGSPAWWAAVDADRAVRIANGYTGRRHTADELAAEDRDQHRIDDAEDRALGRWP